MNDTHTHTRTTTATEPELSRAYTQRADLLQYVKMHAAQVRRTHQCGMGLAVGTGDRPWQIMLASKCRRFRATWSYASKIIFLSNEQNAWAPLFMHLLTWKIPNNICSKSLCKDCITFNKKSYLYLSR